MLIAQMNNKGGVGKTSVTINLADALANRGKRVLVVDQDSQCNSTSSLLPSTVQNTLHQFFEGTAQIQQCIYMSKFEGVDILPNAPSTAAMEMPLYGNLGTSARLYIDKLRPYVDANYDFCLIDCPPTIGLWLVMALAASDSAVVPVDAGSAYAIDGLTTSIRIINDVAQRANPNLAFLRVLINKADRRTLISRTLVDFIRTTFGSSKIFHTTIPYATAIQRAELSRTSVVRFAPRSVATRRYLELADEVISIEDAIGAPK